MVAPDDLRVEIKVIFHLPRELERNIRHEMLAKRSAYIRVMVGKQPLAMFINMEKEEMPIMAVPLMDNVILIGSKPFMSYVTAVVMHFTTRNAAEVVIKARGKHISQAVDVAEISCNRFLDGIARVADVKIGSESLKAQDGRQVRVSAIEIVLVKK